VNFLLRFSYLCTYLIISFGAKPVKVYGRAFMYREDARTPKADFALAKLLTVSTVRGMGETPGFNIRKLSFSSIP
jgi:hypothetical protein